MYVIKSNKPNAILWDPSQNKTLCRFKGGVFETNNKPLAEKLVALGFEVEGDGEQPPSSAHKKPTKAKQVR